jgi:hypothetical protein
VPNALQDRPTRTSASRDLPPRRRGTAVGVGAAALLAVLVLVGADRALDALPSWDAPLEEQAVDRSRPALLLALSDLDEFHAAKGNFQVVVDLEKDVRYVPSFVKGERTTYLAVGSVDGLVDFSGLRAGAVQTDGTSVTITLPRPRLDEPDLDLAESRVLDRDRGVVDRVGGALSDNPTSERDVALLAEDKLAAAAAESDLLRRTEANTRAMLTGLAGSFGYEDVTVRFVGRAGV